MFDWVVNSSLLMFSKELCDTTCIPVFHGLRVFLGRFHVVLAWNTRGVCVGSYFAEQLLVIAFGKLISASKCSYKKTHRHNQNPVKHLGWDGTFSEKKLIIFAKKVLRYMFNRVLNQPTVNTHKTALSCNIHILKM